MNELGLKLSAEDIYSLNKASIKDAIVLFGGFCTAEVVSSRGLMLTNHHCGYSSIQSHSSVDHDYLQNGFWAKNLEEELPNPELSATFLISIEDVTDKILANTSPGMSEQERTLAINEVKSALEKEAAEGTGYMASVASFYSNNNFYLLVYETYNDIRLVGAPPSSIGKFGFDTDNWEWPRHTGDFSVFRVYAGPDGKPAPYSKDNVPLKPKYWLPVSLKDFGQNDFAMILGYPGRTQRFYTSYEVNEIMKISNPNRVKIRGVKQDIWMADMASDPKINIQYASKYSISSNYWKYSIGQNNQLKNLDVMSKKQRLEDQFREWMNADTGRIARYGEALNLIKGSIEGRAEYQYALQYLNECIQGCELLINSSRVGFMMLAALQSGDNNKISDAVARARSGMPEMFKDYSAATDQKSMKAMLRLFRTDVPVKYHPDFYSLLVDKKFKRSIDKFVDNMFERSIFVSEAKLSAFLNKPVQKTLENDPAFITLTSFKSVAIELSKEVGRFEENLAKGRREWVAALREMTPEKTLYPDANSTLRLSYGTIRDYDPRDAVTYKYYTTLQGVVEKYKQGDYEFDLPPALIDLYKRKEYGRYASQKGYMPVCFLTTNDITGGNSGSPVLNGSGELIGLAFDGNWEAMSGDVAYEPSLQRTIVVDIRYVLWIIDIFSGAKNIVDEMTIAQ
jgi:hypothetical protein